jgi:hypothetical protein
LSRMKGNFHVRFLGEGASAMTLSYPTDFAVAVWRRSGFLRYSYAFGRNDEV